MKYQLFQRQEWPGVRKFILEVNVGVKAITETAF
jgi:hypothetical protein